MTPPRRRHVVPWLAANAASAWTGLAISFVLTLTGSNTHLDPTRPTLLGNVANGVATPLQRLLDWLTYFTIWSNIVVAVVLTVLVARPGLFTRADRVGATWRALRLDSVMMIVITGVVYNVLLATGGQTGWQFWSNAFLHVVTPLVTVLVWIVAGPRGLLSRGVVGGALILPAVWLAWALTRGAVIGAYPYGFLDVAANGVPSVALYVVGIAAAGLALGWLMLGVDTLLRWTAGSAER